MNRDDSHWLANATVIERRPLSKCMYETESDEQMESEKKLDDIKTCWLCDIILPEFIIRL